MKFTKMHGCGNDYIYINGAEYKIPAQEKTELVQKLSDRHFGIGGDGVIFINPSDEADFEMEMYNADGSRAEMCGNGIRCVAKYVYDKGLADRTQISIVSAGKIKYLTLTVENGKVSMVRVDMGKPELNASLIPVISEQEQVVDEEITVGEKVYRMTCVSMGNPHAVVFADNVADLDLTKIGPHFEQHERFPKRINTEFVRVIDRHNVEMRVWERGTGETLACGTGCCATAVACVLNGKTEADVTVKVLGGEIRIQWDREADTVFMTGPASTVFEGEIDL
ncbi:MAG: diaminopimelate epimerase [Lachnospiraceae bacterium]|nr:diaminopimelate epimerase [Lachnospiraceae bacterium]